MNISTALASMRYKEVGVRKVMGAGRRQIIIQLCSETVILASVAFVLGILIAELFLPTFNRLAEKTLYLDYFNRWYSSTWAILFIGSIGLLSGLFPSILLSKYPPAELYKNKQLTGGKDCFHECQL